MNHKRFRSSAHSVFLLIERARSVPQFFDRFSVTHRLHRRETVETAQRNHSVVLAIARVQPECLKIQRWRLEQPQLELALIGGQRRDGFQPPRQKLQVSARG